MSRRPPGCEVYVRFYVEQHEMEHAGNEVNPPEPVTGLLVINDYDI